MNELIGVSRVELLAWLVIFCRDPGISVLDVFLGGGRTVARKMNRN